MKTILIELLLVTRCLPSSNRLVQLSVMAEVKRIAEILSKEVGALV